MLLIQIPHEDTNRKNKTSSISDHDVLMGLYSIYSPSDGIY